MRILKPIPTVLFLTLATGCASFEKKVTTAAELQQNKATNSQLNQQVNDATTQVEQAYLEAKEENFSYYAPRTWASVEENIVAMRKLVNRFDPNDQGFFGGPSESAVLASIADVSTLLSQAHDSKNKVMTFLMQPLADIAYLSPQISEERQREFSSITQDLEQLIDSIDANYVLVKRERARKQLQAKITDLELSIVTAKYYSPLKEQLKFLNRQLIPQSYDKASLGLQQLNVVIAASPRDKAALSEAANTVSNYLKSAEHISADVKWINSLDKNQREEIVLQYRTVIENLGLKFLNQDLSNLSYKAQVSKFERALSTQLGEFETKDSEVTITDNAAIKIKNAPVKTSPEKVTVKTTQLTTNN